MSTISSTGLMLFCERRGSSASHVVLLANPMATTTEAASAAHEGRGEARPRVQPRGKNRRVEAAIGSARENTSAPRRHCDARQPFLYRSLERLDAFALRRQRRIVCELPLELECMRGVELAIEISMQEQARLVVHGLRHLACVSSFAMLATSRRRARASRDITVPIGTFVTCAISR